MSSVRGDTNMKNVEAALSKSNIKLEDLKKFDMYGKVDEDHSVQTSTGAVLSVGGYCIIFLL